MEFALGYIIKETLRAFFLPPGGIILLLLFALFRWRSAYSKYLAGFAVLLMYVLSTPYMAQTLHGTIEPQAINLQAPLDEVDAIICLGGGKRFEALDFPQGEALSTETLARTRYAARLQRKTGKPVLVSGGMPIGGIAEATLMRDALENDFQIAVKWVEDQSNDTADNASMSAQLLLPKHKHIALVTSASHMLRAQRAFEAAGFTVTAAPTEFINREPRSFISFLPNNKAFLDSSSALREWIGSLWYRLRLATSS